MKTKLPLGLQVFGALMALTFVEFWIAATAQGPIPYPILCGLLAPITWLAILVQRAPLPFLALIAIAKAVLVARYFMHIAQLWRKEAHA